MRTEHEIADTARKASVAGLAVLLFAAAVRAEPVRPVLDLTSVRLDVVWVEDEGEINRMREQFVRPHYRVRTGASIGSRSTLRGFSVLRRTADGQFSCTIYVRKPRRVDDRHTLSLGHEVAHCLLGAYH